jgi:predicted alpha/beta superfamily hydrolase
MTFASVCSVALLFLASLVAGVPAYSRETDRPISIGTSTQIWSKVLKENRRVFVYQPEGYGEGHKRYPVLYLLDAENQFLHSIGIVQFLAATGRIPQLIVVGITNTDRDRDLTPPTSVEKEIRENPTAGGAERFLSFIVAELAPWVESRYRTAPFRILVGHSYGGLFDIYALTTRPRDFQAFIAISPALGWDDRHYLQKAEESLPALEAPHFLFLACGDQERRIAETSQELATWVEAHPVPGLTFAFQKYVGEVHGTTPHRSLYDGLEKLYAGWHERGDSAK